MANRVPTLLATAVAAACSLSAHASGPTQADYAKVVLYSNVTIAQDSASQWGIWEELEPTAAGPQTPLPLLAGTSEPYRPLGSITPTTPVTPPTVTNACVSGGLCGFGVMTMSTYSWNGEVMQPAEVSESNLVRVGFQLLPQTNGEPSWLPESMTVSTRPIRTDMADTVPSLNNVGPLVFDGFNSHDYQTPDVSLPAGTQGNYEHVRIETDIESLPSGVPAGMFQGSVTIVKYVSGGADTYPISGTEQHGPMYGVWGITTSAQDMNNLRLSDAQASYSGFTFGADGASTGSVKMNVNFGASTFTADFNGGLNVQSPLVGGQVQKAANGSYQVNGALSFRASGAINGSLFSANALQIAGANNSITGKVEGAFFGSNAAVAAGVADVSAVVTPTGFTSPVYARYATPFVTTKDVANTPR